MVVQAKAYRAAMSYCLAILDLQLQIQMASQP